MANLTSFRIEGGLFPSDFAERLTSKSSSLDGLSPTDYGKQDQAERDEAIQIAFRQTLSAWRRLQAALQQAPKGDTHTSLTRERFLLPLFEAMGYGRLPLAKAQKLGERTYAISHQWMTVPIHLLGIAVDLDRRDKGIRGASQASPHGLVQEYLNASDQVLWALLSNGYSLRLLRDHKSLTRNAYIEFDLDRICDDEDYPGFALLWLLCHSSRAAADKPELVWWEKWYEQSRQDGVRVLDRLRDGVKLTIEALGSGFLEHPANQALRDALKSGALSTDSYYRLLLRVVYRLLFLFVAEDREVLLQSREEFEDARRRFMEHYGTGRLRNLAAAIRGTQHGDLWQALRLVMDKLGDGGCPALGLPDLGPGFWGKEQLGLLSGAELRNVHMLEAVRALAFTHENGVLHPVRYRDLGATEFGSVYESLLELKPQQVRPELFSLAQAAGNERKTTGAYYTPDSLVQCLLDSALEPLLARCREAKDPAAELLDLKVCDPACGSGHFLVAAAHRIAKALAQVRSGDDEPSPVARREAMRDVVARCLYGVDLSEMAVELCKVNLWLEAQAPDLPLAFLDAHIQQGNSLLGATPELIGKGIPDEAMEPLLGDDREFCKQLKKENKARRKGGGMLFDVEGKRGFAWSGKTLAKDYLVVEAVADRSATEVREKAEAYGRWAASEARLREELIADAWCAAFVMKKTKDAPPPVTQELFVKLRDGGSDLPKATRDEVKRLGREFRFCHWWLKFPGAFAEGLRKRGFDLVIGNPPWERTSFEEIPFFSARDTNVAVALTTASRSALIRKLEESNPTLFASYLEAKRSSAAVEHLISQCGRFVQTAVGRIDTYAVFTDLASGLIHSAGLCALVVPTGIASAIPLAPWWRRVFGESRVHALLDFDNTAGYFPGVDSRKKFCLLVLGGCNRRVARTKFSFFTRSTNPAALQGSIFAMSVEDLCAINPETAQPPIVSNPADLALLLYAHRRSRPNGETSPGWVGYTSAGTGDSWVEVRDPNGNDVASPSQSAPLIEGKMVHQFDHRFATYEGCSSQELESGSPQASGVRRGLRTFRVTPRFRVPIKPCEDFRERKSQYHKFVGVYRDYTSATNERTLIATLLADGVPMQPLNGFAVADAAAAALAVARLNAFATDFFARLKTPDIHLNVTIFDQLPGEVHTTEGLGILGVDVRSWMLPRSLELLCTSDEFDALAKDCDVALGGGQWSEARRFQLRCELDAAFFYLWFPMGRDGGWLPSCKGVPSPDSVRRWFETPRQAVCHVMDAFPIVRKKDEEQYGDYRTKLTILDIYDQLAAAAKPVVAPVPATAPRPAQPAAASLEWDSKVLEVAAAAAGIQVRDDEWATSVSGENLGMQALAAVLRALPSPRSRAEVERAVLYVVLPRLLSPRFDSACAGRWRRVVGRANLAVESVAVLGIPWQTVVRRAANQGVLVETADGRWVAGAGVPTPAPQLVARALVASALVAADAEVTAEELNEMRCLGAA